MAMKDMPRPTDSRQANYTQLYTTLTPVRGDSWTSQPQHDEIKKILILSAIFFLGTIILIMSKMQIPTEDVVRWSPIVWLLGVVLAGLSCNGIFFCRKVYLKKRQRERRTALYNLPIPSSYPCLAPPPHFGCSRAMRSNRAMVQSPSGTHAVYQILPPTYDEAVKHNVVKCDSPQLPPNYDEALQMIQEPSPEYEESHTQPDTVSASVAARVVSVAPATPSSATPVTIEQTAADEDQRYDAPVSIV